MVREVGPIAENVLEKYLGGLRESRKDVFAGVKLQKDGTLDPPLVERNLNKLPEEERRGRLVDAPQRAALRRAPGREAHAGGGARGRDHQGLPRAVGSLDAPASRSGARCILLPGRAAASALAPVDAPLIAIVGPTAAGKSELALRPRPGAGRGDRLLRQPAGLPRPRHREREGHPSDAARSAASPLGRGGPRPALLRGPVLSPGPRCRSRDFGAGQAPGRGWGDRSLPARAPGRPLRRTVSLRAASAPFRPGGRSLRRSAALAAPPPRRSVGRGAHPAEGSCSCDAGSRGLLDDGRPLSDHHRAGAEPLRGFRTLVVVLDPGRDALRKRIETRTRRMLEDGLLDEVRGSAGALPSRHPPLTRDRLQASGVRDPGADVGRGA